MIYHRLTLWTMWLIPVVLLTGCGKASLPLAKQKHGRGEYFDAATLYRKVYAETSSEKRVQRSEIAFQMGLCYQQLNQHARAATAFQNAVRYVPTDTTAILHWARMLHAQGKYLLAMKQYERCLELVPGSVSARKGMEGVRSASEWRAEPTRYAVKREPLFNSRRAEFSPILAGDTFDQLYFTTSNDKYVKTINRSAITGIKDNDLFMTRKNERGEWEKPMPIEGELNSESDEGTASISSDGRYMYLTLCRKSDQYPTSAKIIRSERLGGKWGEPLPFATWNDSTLMAAHPAIDPRGDWLYFVSDKLGGYGGKDIYRMAITERGDGTIENLGGQINTDGDEMFPYMRSNGELYFASNGHVGMGGLDLFRARPTKEGSWRVENMKYPINSSADDFGITFAGDAEEGYFSSNRNDVRGWDHIYSFRLPAVSISLEGFVMDKEDEIIHEATIRIVGNDGTIIKTRPKTNGTYKVLLNYGREYVMQAVANGYLSNKQTLATVDREKDTIYVQNFTLTPVSRPVIVENIFYAFNNADILPESAAALNEVVAMMDEHPYIRIEMGAHTDRKGSNEYNDRLSARRAQLVVNYLVSKGIAPNRLISRGYGKNVPKIINKKTAEKHTGWLKEGDVLNEVFIDSLSPEQQEEADQLNRRTEFTIISTGYKLQ